MQREREEDLAIRIAATIPPRAILLMALPGDGNRNDAGPCKRSGRAARGGGSAGGGGKEAQQPVLKEKSAILFIVVFEVVLIAFFVIYCVSACM